MLEPKVPDEQLVKISIADACIQVTGQEHGAIKLHTLLQRTIACLSSRFALSAETEYVLPGFRGERDGHLDVVWKYGSIPVVAFEIDSAYRIKSLRKLIAVNANLRFWIYFGIADGEAIARRIDPIGIIRVIHLSASPDKQDRLTRIAKDELASPADGLVRSQEDAGNAHGFAKIRERYPRAYERWTPEEDHSLQMQFQNGVKVSELATCFQRKLGAIRSRLKKLGLISGDAGCQEILRRGRWGGDRLEPAVSRFDGAGHRRSGPGA